MITTLAHVCIFSSDLDRTKQFYCGLLGLRKLFNFVRGEELIGYYLEVDSRIFIEVFLKDLQGAPERPRIAHFCLETSDIDAVRERLISGGVATTEKILGPDHSWQVWCKDPDGIDIEFHQYTEKSTQVTGADCVVDW